MAARDIVWTEAITHHIVVVVLRVGVEGGADAKVACVEIRSKINKFQKQEKSKINKMFLVCFLEQFGDT